ncbi:MAG: M10 family metallopeptidase domain-containing protein [Actinomycetota bacterium]|nr:M10 family metallopeptidase domain-containing protein [Actinomycetota bacterium]
MKTRSPLVSWAFAAALSCLVLAQALPAGASRERAAPPFCGDSGVISADRLPATVAASTCDLVGRTIEAGSVRLRVPPPGNAVGAAAISESGEAELTITTLWNGDVVLGDGEAVAAPMLAGAAEDPCDARGISGCLAPCEDENFHTYAAYASPKVKERQPWFFKARSTPSSLTRTQALTHIKLGTRNVVTGYNDCGLPDPVTQTAPYKGTTRTGTGITVVGTGDEKTMRCGSSDAKNVVDFGPLLSTGLACWRAMARDINGPWFITEADIRLEKGAPWILNADDPTCFNKVDLQGVMTHERGHAFGLDHSDSVVAHTSQTMFPVIYPCSTYSRTLGRGDHMGLDSLY